MKKLTTIVSFKEGNKVQGFYLCIKKNLRHTRSGDLYIDIELRDITGHAMAKIWDNVAELNKMFEAGDAVAVSGEVECFLDRNQINIKKIKKATVQHYSRYGFDPANIVPTSKKNPIKMWKEIQLIIESIKNKYLQTLVLNIFKTNKKKIMYHPASVNMHYNYRSGFLEHILRMATIAKRITLLYDLDKDLVMTGVLLHKIGKINEINSEYIISKTKEGNLLGHNVIGRDMVRDFILKIKGFPDDYSMKIEHIILSHQGRYEWKSHKLPSFPEALLLHLIGFMDSRMSLMDIVINDDLEIGDFTNNLNYFNIPIFKKSGTK